MFGDHNVKGSIAHKTRKIPRSIPTDILPQLDLHLMRAIQMMESAQEPGILKPVYWDAIIILRRTGIRFEELVHLKELDDQGRDCCLNQDSGGFWWLHIYRKTNKLVKDHRIPIRESDGVIEALHRQKDRVRDIPSDEKYLFRDRKGILKTSVLRAALERDLAPYLIHDGQPYIISPLQFRHTIAVEMIQQGIDVYTVKEFLGHSSLAAMDRYIQYQPISPSGICTMSHSPELVPCPHRGFVPSSALDVRPDLSLWQDKAQKLLITIETLRRKPDSAGKAQRLILEQELQEVEKGIEAIQEERDEDRLSHDC